MGRKAYSSVEEIAEPIDAAIVITPPPTVPPIVDQCARKDVKAVIIVSENFTEAGGKGAHYQEQLEEIAVLLFGKELGDSLAGNLATVGNDLIDTVAAFQSLPNLIPTQFSVSHLFLRNFVTFGGKSWTNCSPSKSNKYAA
jgi:hypothetical protein